MSSQSNRCHLSWQAGKMEAFTKPHMFSHMLFVVDAHISVLFLFECDHEIYAKGEHVQYLWSQMPDFILWLLSRKIQ